jgi:hypothetical protein
MMAPESHSTPLSLLRVNITSILNASSFTVRCVASTGASRHAVILGGLAALSGPRHGGMTSRVGSLLDFALVALRQYLDCRWAPHWVCSPSAAHWDGLRMLSSSAHKGISYGRARHILVYQRKVAANNGTKSTI